MAVDDDIDFDLLAAALRADSTDLRAFMEVMATKLEAALPGATQVTRQKASFRGPKVVREIVVSAGGARLLLRRQGDAVVAMQARVSGGITLKTEEMDIDHWLGSLTEILGTEAQRSLQTRQALARLLDTT
jgi:hypothetical protein